MAQKRGCKITGAFFEKKNGIKMMGDGITPHMK
jgi:hypothetical protein